MKSDHNTNILDLIIIMAYMVIFSIISIVSSNSAVLFVLGIPFIFILPGYLLITAMYPRRHALTLAERIALTVGLSFILLPSIGLLLNFTPFGIQQVPVLVGVVIFSTLLCIVVWYQRKNIPIKEQFSPLHDLQNKISGLKNIRDSHRTDRSQLIPNLLIIIIIIIIIGIIFMLYILAVEDQPKEQFTVLIILDEHKNIVEKPLEMDINDTAYFTVMVTNHEGENYDYVLRVRAIEYTEQWTLNDTIDNTNEVSTDDINFDIPLSLDVNLSYHYTFTLNDGESLEKKLGVGFQEHGNYQLRMELFNGKSSDNNTPDHLVYVIILVN